MRRRVSKEFPRWKNGKITSPMDEKYNCIAWAFGDTERKWWPNFTGHYWPSPKVTNHDLRDLQNYLLSQNWISETSSTTTKNEANEKLAIYAIGEQLKHVARHVGQNRWTSKLGDGHDVEHDF